MTDRKIMNAIRIEHICSNGTVFKAERGDLSSGVIVCKSYPITKERRMADFAEFGAWHSFEIHPNLNGFGGYNNINYIFD